MEKQQTDPIYSNRKIKYNMVANSKTRAAKYLGKSVDGLLPTEYTTFEQATDIWDPLIANNKTCFECGISVVELQNYGIDQATPQRPDATRDYKDQPDGVKVFCMGCQRYVNFLFFYYKICIIIPLKIRLYMEHDLDYQQNLKNLIHSSQNPLPIAASPLDDLSNFVHPGPSFRPTHDNKFNKNGQIIPPDDIGKAIKLFWKTNVETMNNGHSYTNSDAYINKRRENHVGCTMQELYKLWWLSGDICSISGAIGNWEVNSFAKLTFDRIIPGAAGGTTSLIKSCNFSFYYRNI